MAATAAAFRHPRAKACLAAALACACVVMTARARAETPAAAAVSAPAPAPPPPPYSLPWQLRPATVANVVRSDTSVAFYSTKNPMTNEEMNGSTVASTLLGSYKVTPSLAPLVRLAMVRNEEPGDALGSAAAFVNPFVGLAYGLKLPADLRMSAFVAGTIPIGMGGNEKRATNATAAAAFRGIAARSAMDNAMFAVNYFTALGGADLAWVAKGFTAQAEVTLLQLFRVRNEAVDTDGTRTNLTAGLHAGYFVARFLSFAGELRYQRWLSTPAAVAAAPAARETATWALGTRFHFKTSPTTWLRPGLSYSRAIDDPLAASGYHIAQVDLPFVF
jgi:hypothetical protein